jgi:hypothetical protein
VLIFSYSLPKWLEILLSPLVNDHIRFMYLYLLNDKFVVLNAFNTYKEEEGKRHEDHKI